MPHIVVGSAGHIDHGKTALVKALTGVDTDRLKEEKERGITIDLGFASLDLPEGGVSFIDVPGHERFIKNMLAGVGGIDAVMLIIAADESVKPQTREHLDICSLLHVKHGFTVLTKVDRVSPEMLDRIELEVREFLKGSFLESAPILRVSSTTRSGLPGVMQHLQSLLMNIPPRDQTSAFRMPIDRAFSMKGFGTVVTGTLLNGSVKIGDEGEILPSGRKTRIRGVHVHGRTTSIALAGQRTAVNLHGVQVSEVGRGAVLGAPAAYKASSMFNCELRLLPAAPSAIQMRKRIRFHIGTAELMGYAVVLGKERLEPGETGLVQVRLESQTVGVSGDRFIIRQYSPMITIGGGEILEIAPKKHRRMDAEVIDRLKTLQRTAIHERRELFQKKSVAVVHPPVPVLGPTTAELKVRSAIELGFRQAGLEPDRPDQVIQSLRIQVVEGRRAIRALVSEKLLVKVSDDLVLHRDVVNDLIGRVRVLKERSVKLTVGDFKQLTGVSRKFAIPLLEFLDRQRVTKKSGDDRTIL